MTYNVEVIKIENKDQAQSMANFLWNECQRHYDDIERARKDLAKLRVDWGVVPNLKRVYVEV